MDVVSADDATVMVSEIFGPTIQGEGPSAGQRAAFVRLGRCNLDCSWCDTPYTWDWTGKNGTVYRVAEELTRWTVPSVVAHVHSMDAPLCVITGGEPMLQRSGMSELVPALVRVVARVEIETNGTRTPLDYRPVRYNVSPKLASSGVARPRAWPSREMSAYTREDAVFKFVITSSTVADVIEVREFVTRFGVADERVWLMPEGTGTDPVDYDLVAEAAIANGWNFTGRLHSLAWGKERGR